jgi:anti-sigma regulatory factor (Ser/Thr protein kinase)
MCRTNGVEYPTCETATPGRARRFAADEVSQALPAADATVSDDTALVISELATNAVRAGCSTLSVAVEVHRSHVRLGVRDDAPGWPQQLAGGPGDLNGRGLVIVDTLSQRWGARHTDAGKEVWAELSVPEDVAQHVSCQL